MTTSVRSGFSRYGVPVACRACGTHIVYPQPCSHCGLDPVRYATGDLDPAEPPAGQAGWFRRPHDPVDVERWWDGSAWTRQIRGGEQIAWLERLTTMAPDQQTPYTEDQIDLLTIEVERIRNLVTTGEQARRRRPQPEQAPRWSLAGMARPGLVDLPAAPLTSRAVSLLIDLALIGLVVGGIGWTLQPSQSLLLALGAAVAALAYLAGGWGGGATLGMRTVEIRLADAHTGRSIGWRRGLVRALVVVVGLPLLVGLWSSLLDRGRYRRCLADVASGAVVVRSL